MAKVLVVTSGKGGVGKTTSTAALGAALAQAGQKVAVVDFDVGLRNLDLVMGAERRVVFDFINVIQGVAKLSQALIRDKRIDTLILRMIGVRRSVGINSHLSDHVKICLPIRDLAYLCSTIIESHSFEYLEFGIWQLVLINSATSMCKAPLQW